jgi:hypothetical protein
MLAGHNQLAAVDVQLLLWRPAKAEKKTELAHVCAPREFVRRVIFTPNILITLYPKVARPAG